MNIRGLISSTALSLLMVIGFAVDARAQQVIRDFDSYVTVSPDGKLDVNERIDMDFGGELHHGIFRQIPIRYVNSKAVRETPMRILDVTADGSPAKYNAQRQFNDLMVKIGDPDIRISGRHVYRLHYVVLGAINVFDREPEIYWNATGNEWPFPIEHVHAQFILPSGIDGTKLRVKSFQGTQGSKDSSVFKQRPNAIDFEANDLAPGQGLTYVLRMPEGSVKVDSGTGTQLWWLLSEWWPAVVIPGTTLAFMLSLWWTCGRDRGNAHLSGVDWNPPKELSPAEVGTLVDESCDVADIVSTVVDLAARGYLKIQQFKSSVFLFSSTDYQFIRTDPPANSPPLKPYEKLFLATVFVTGSPVMLSSLKYKFYEDIPAIRNYIYRSLTDNGYFTDNPDKCRSSYWALAIIFGFVGFLLLAIKTPWAIALLISGVVVAALAGAMPARTGKGVEACRQSLGFRRFVQKAEKERIRVLAKDDPTVFGRLLPYAMVLGAADQWAYVFHDLLTQPPDWYQPYNWNTPGYMFSSTDFVNDLGDGMRTCASTLTAAPSSSSSGGGSGASGFSDFGGFSGGGFGGGGGGSW